MNSKVSTSELVSELVSKTGVSKEVCESFIKSLFKNVIKTLANNGSVRINDFGNFKIIEVEEKKSIDVSTGHEIEMPRHNKIIFIPSKEFAAKLNYPFDCFSAVGITVSQELEEGEEGDLTDKRFYEQSDEEDLDDIATSEAYHYYTDEEVKEEVVAPKNKTDQSHIENTQPLTDAEEDYESYEYEREDTSNRKFAYGAFWGALCMLLVCGTIFLIGIYNGWYGEGWKNKYKDEQADAASIIMPETELPDIKVESTEIPAEDQQTSVTENNEEKVYDTVSTTRYLTTIAREHYGNYHFWPYIYEENKAIMGHPNRIKPGTKVVVPPLSKYGVDPKNQEDLETAKKLEKEIYARYN